ncbi:MAG: hypothetical protein R3B47_04280 [Bacteroidia bacterium]
MTHASPKTEQQLAELDRSWHIQEMAFLRQNRRNISRKLIVATMLFLPSFPFWFPMLEDADVRWMLLKLLLPCLVVYVVSYYTVEAYRWSSRYEQAKAQYEAKRKKMMDMLEY